MAKNRSAGKSDRTLPVRYQESPGGMSFRPGLVIVMAAQRLLDLPQRVGPLRLRLPLPEKCKSLAAYTAARFDLFTAALAKYLHLTGPSFLSP